MRMKKPYEEELLRRIKKCNTEGDKKTAKAIETQLRRFRRRNPIRRFKKSFQEGCLLNQVKYELLRCILQGQAQYSDVLQEIRDTRTVSNETLELLDHINPQHQI